MEVALTNARDLTDSERLTPRVAGGEGGGRGMGRTHGTNSTIPMMTSTAERQNAMPLAPAPGAPGATLWAFVVGILVGIALGVLR
jgi:hypothetical protein